MCVGVGDPRSVLVPQGDGQINEKLAPAPLSISVANISGAKASMLPTQWTRTGDAKSCARPATHARLTPQVPPGRVGVCRFNLSCGRVVICASRKNNHAKTLQLRFERRLELEGLADEGCPETRETLEPPPVKQNI